MRKCIASRLTVPLLTLVLAIGCGQSNTPVTPSSEKEAHATPEGRKYLLAEEPAGAKGVIAVRKDAKDGDEVVLVGRIGGEKKPWVEGRASFWVIDLSLKSCSDTEGDDCPTPWDYCCTPRETLTPAMATVKIVDDKGQTVATDARKLLGLQELQTVVVRGRAKRDEGSNLVVVASAIYVRPDGKK